MHLFVEHVFVILSYEFWENFSIVSEIVDKGFKSLTVTIQENFLVNLFESVHV